MDASDRECARRGAHRFPTQLEREEGEAPRDDLFSLPLSIFFSPRERERGRREGKGGGNEGW